jgi:uncharacterized protein
MSRRTLRSRALAATLVCLAGVAVSALDVPYLTGRVVDNANILKPETRGRISAASKAHEDSTGNQIAVLTVPSIKPDTIEDYAVKVFEAWKLGQKGKDNGVLVIVVPQDRAMRIEVGYGLEGTLTDGTCGQIVRNVMAPAFKAGDYDGGVEAGVAAIIAKVDGTGEPPADAPGGGSGSASHSNTINAPDLPWQERILIGAFVFGIIGLFTFIGVMTPGVGWFLFFFLIPFWAMFPIIVVGTSGAFRILVTYLIGFPLVKLWVRRQPWYTKAAADMKSKGSAKIGGFTFTGGSSGSSWSSGGSSGGFSGGGGSSGGGGASGSW